jgi:Mg-chelatase subunit ChlI
VDVLLDSAAMGVNMVEREGISFTHPARFILVGTMNPEEGELRPQLLDRFALSVDIVGIREARERVMIMERNLAFEQDAEVFRKKWMPKEEELSHQIERARELVGQVTHTSRDLLSIAALTASLNVDGHRADLVILNDHDIALAAELALPHRIKRTPFQQAEMTTEQLQERIEQLAGQSVPSEAEEESESQQSKAEEKKT